MTLLILVAWVILTRWGSSVVIWPRGAATPPPVRDPVDRVPLDRASVTAEAVVAFIVVAAVPFTFVSDAFSTLERVGLAVLSPVIVRYGLDRLAKLRAGHLASWDDHGLSVPGLPARTIERSRVTSVKARRVAFGPNDIVIGGGRLPIVLDTQFTTLDEATLTGSLVDWMERPTP